MAGPAMARASAAPPITTRARTSARLVRESSGIRRTARDSREKELARPEVAAAGRPSGLATASSAVSVAIVAVVAVVARRGPARIHVVQDDAEKASVYRAEEVDAALGRIPARPAVAQHEDGSLQPRRQDHGVAHADQ